MTGCRYRRRAIGPFWGISRRILVTIRSFRGGIIEHIADRVIMMRSGQIIWQGVWSEGDGSLEDFYLKEFGEETMEAKSYE